MMKYRSLLYGFLSVLLIGSGVVSCGSGSGEATCNLVSNEGCGDGLVCQETQNGEPACYQALLMSGTLTDAQNGLPIAGARIVAVDANGAAVSDVVTTDANGNYTLEVSALRDANGNPVGKITLKADAANYQPYPGIRTPFAIDLATAVKGDKGWLIDSSIADLALNRLPVDAPGGRIQGSIQVPLDRSSVLVVAELKSGDACPALPYSNCTAIATADGSYVIYNLPAGDYNVKGYVQGYNYAPVAVSLSDGQTATAGALNSTNRNVGTLSGKVNIVNASLGDATSVILVLESTLLQVNSGLYPEIPVLIRGAAVPGLRVGNVSGSFTFEGVPEGRYVILAAFEDDFLVRDPDFCQGGTEIIHQTLTEGQNINLDQAFKVTDALTNPDPDNNELVSSTPLFTWDDDSSEKYYAVTVLDAFGNLIWETEIPGFNNNAHLDYAGPALESGKYYQFNVLSIRESNEKCPISQTEDLQGTFQVQ